MKTHDDPHTVARRWFEEVWNDRRDEAVDELMAPKAIGHVEGQEDLCGPADFKKMKAMFLSALPDVRIEIEDILAEGERAAVRWRAVGTHSGEGFGFRATNQPIEVRGTTWMIVRHGKIVEGFDTWNLGAMMHALREAASA
ncbi:MAG TPA: ester cyclase [Thermoanaerobaculia bacterium]|nr:ester cyclase [Thermoanaerobaculia bacterium]